MSLNLDFFPPFTMRVSPLSAVKKIQSYFWCWKMYSCFKWKSIHILLAEHFTFLDKTELLKLETLNSGNSLIYMYLQCTAQNKTRSKMVDAAGSTFRREYVKKCGLSSSCSTRDSGFCFSSSLTKFPSVKYDIYTVCCWEEGHLG